MDLSILDQIPIFKNESAKQALDNAVSLAQQGEKYGYKRVWYAEHHGGESLASSAPEIVIGQVAAKTNHINVGSGGIMMMHYSPLKIAEVFKTLAAFYPGRIDLGLGRAPGGDRHAIFALSEGRAPQLDNLYNKIDTIHSLLKNELPENELYQHTAATPAINHYPSSWLLGSSGDSALQAAVRGMGYSYAQFFHGQMNQEAFEIYNSRFQPSDFMPEKKLSVAFFALACETEEEARYYERPYAIFKMKLAKGERLEKFLSPEEAADYPLSDLDKALLEKISESHLVGTADQIVEQLLEQQRLYQFDEAMIITITQPHEVRLNSYRLIAEAMKLTNKE